MDVVPDGAVVVFLNTAAQRVISVGGIGPAGKVDADKLILSIIGEAGDGGGRLIGLGGQITPRGQLA